VCCAYCPTGTVLGFPTASLVTLAPPRSVKEVGPDVESAGTTSTRTLRAKSRRVPGSMRPCDASASICGRPALANTSTGAPDSICFCKAPDAPKLKLTFPPVRDSYCLPISPKASLRLTAAETVTSRAGCELPLDPEGSDRRQAIPWAANTIIIADSQSRPTTCAVARRRPPFRPGRPMKPSIGIPLHGCAYQLSVSSSTLGVCSNQRRLHHIQTFPIHLQSPASSAPSGWPADSYRSLS